MMDSSKEGRHANYSEVHHFRIPKRTDGDGMEQGKEIFIEDSVKSDIDLSRSRVDSSSGYLNHCIPGSAVHIFPAKTYNKKECTSQCSISYSKNPKFVPYEPYKAAVKPIVPIKSYSQKKEKNLVKTFNLISNVVQENAEHSASKSSSSTEHSTREGSLSTEHSTSEGLSSTEHLPSEGLSSSEFSTIEGSSVAESSFEVHNSIMTCFSEADAEKEVSKSEISRLKEENYELENQLKFQAQVNGELKKLLVAALGEDIEVKVQSLTEDKFHLAKQLLKSAEHLSTHQEQIEWLANQCEVWRSKFLASSVLIEDLARWKAGLCKKVTDYQENLKQLLQERDQIKNNMISSYWKLQAVCNKVGCSIDSCCGTKNTMLSSLSLSASVNKLATLLQNCFVNDNQIDCSLSPSNLKTVLTEAEKSSEQLLRQPTVSFEKTDVACTAVMTGASLALSSAAPHCSHCNGIVQTI